MSPRKQYEEELNKLQESVEEIGVYVQSIYVKVFSALDQKQESSLQEVVSSDRDIHAMQRAIEAGCLNLITRQQPIAKDLRQVTATLKAVTDISRIGDQCVDIAELLLRMNMKKIAEFSSHLPEMIEKTKDQLAEALEVLMQRDVEEAKTVIEKDDLVDDLFNLVKDDIIAHLKNGKKDPDDCVDVLMIAKHLEKIGDHAENMAQWAIFRETGAVENIRLM